MMSFQNTPMQSLSIAIVGLGSRGLSILERLLHLASTITERSIHIVIFEPNEPGTGVHTTYQPDYLLLNTIACQLSIFPDEAAIGARATRHGPNFYSWCAERNIRIGEDGLPCDAGGRAIAPTDFLPRRLIGEYLAWAYREITSDIPEHIKITFHRENAMRIIPTESHAYTVCGESGIKETVDRLFITIGHAGQGETETGSGAERTIDIVYPLPCMVERIAPGAFIGIEGFGLAAMDTIAALSVGRGGKFRRATNGTITYIPSGSEPRILLYSRSGLPFRVRPDTTMERMKHRALFLTPETIDRLRRSRTDGKIDFEKDVLPLMEDEMRAAYYLACASIHKNHSRNLNCTALRCEMETAYAEGKFNALFERFSEKYGEFFPAHHLMKNVPEQLVEKDYAAWARRFIEEDLKEGARGAFASPLKAALEVWRDLRDALRAVVDHDGLTKESRQVFFSTYSSLINRAVAGPQKERHQELIALIDAGVVMIAPGFNPQRSWNSATGRFELAFSRNSPKIDVEWIVSARVPDSRIFGMKPSVLEDLMKSGLIRPVAPDVGMYGVDIDRDAHPINREGNSTEHIWIFGPIVEGSTYYNHYISPVSRYSRAPTDTHRAASACLDVVASTSIHGRKSHDVCMS